MALSKAQTGRKSGPHGICLQALDRVYEIAFESKIDSVGEFFLADFEGWAVALPKNTAKKGADNVDFGPKWIS